MSPINSAIGKPGIRRAVPTLLGTIAAVLLAASAQAQENGIRSVSVVSESGNEVVLEVAYVYSGDRGNGVFLSAVMATDGKRSQHYAHRPAPLKRGKGRARVTLGTTQKAPSTFSTNQLEISMYVGGEGTFLKQLFSFPKTWSRPGAPLRPVLQVAHHVAPALAVQSVLQAGTGAGGGATKRRILPDGSVELLYPDGTKKHLFRGGYTVTRPGQPAQSVLSQEAQPPTPPTAPPNAAHAPWFDAENARLLEIISGLVGNDAQSIQNYLGKEGPGWSVYQKIDGRTRAIMWLVQP